MIPWTNSCTELWKYSKNNFWWTPGKFSRGVLREMSGGSFWGNFLRKLPTSRAIPEEIYGKRSKRNFKRVSEKSKRLSRCSKKASGVFLGTPAS